jgi:hypothetical protein
MKSLALDSCFDASSLRESASTSLENALGGLVDTRHAQVP